MKERSGHFMQHEYQNLLGNSETQILSNIKLVFDKWDNASVEDNIKCFKQYMGLKLRLRRKQLGLTQTKIAKKLNVTLNYARDKFSKASLQKGACCLPILPGVWTKISIQTSAWNTNNLIWNGLCWVLCTFAK